jgi:hypothetical protein
LGAFFGNEPLDVTVKRFFRSFGLEIGEIGGLEAEFMMFLVKGSSNLLGWYG